MALQIDRVLQLASWEMHPDLQPMGLSAHVDTRAVAGDSRCIWTWIAASGQPDGFGEWWPRVARCREENRACM